jgi:predicted outer membrane protein
MIQILFRGALSGGTIANWKSAVALRRSWRIGGAAYAAIGVLIVSSCASSVEPLAPAQRAVAAAPLRQSATPVAASPFPTPQYFSEATAIDLFELRAADIALQRSTGAARAFATQAEQHHRALSAQLAFAGRYLNLLPSRSLPPDYQQMLDQLGSVTDFDRVYLSQQRQVCARALQLHSRYASAGASPTLRSVAQFGVSVINADLQLLRR